MSSEAVTSAGTGAGGVDVVSGCQMPTGPGVVCGRPVERPATGRPSRYCDEPGHDRAAAWKARRELERAGAAASPAGPREEVAGLPARPVTDARTSLGALLARLEDSTVAAQRAAEAQVAQLGALVTRAGEIVHSISDPDTASYEVDQIQRVATAQVAEAQAGQAAAERAAVEAQRVAEEQREQRAQADEAAEAAGREAAAAVAATEERAAAVEAAAAERVAAAEAERAAAVAEAETVTAAALERARAAQERATAAERALERERAAAEKTRVELMARVGQAEADERRAVVERDMARSQLEQARREAAAERETMRAEAAAERERLTALLARSSAPAAGSETGTTAGTETSEEPAAPKHAARRPSTRARTSRAKTASTSDGEQQPA